MEIMESIIGISGGDIFKFVEDKIIWLWHIVGKEEGIKTRLVKAVLSALVAQIKLNKPVFIDDV